MHQAEKMVGLVLIKLEIGVHTVNMLLTGRHSSMPLSSKAPMAANIIFEGPAKQTEHRYMS